VLRQHLWLKRVSARGGCCGSVGRTEYNCLMGVLALQHLAAHKPSFYHSTLRLIAFAAALTGSYSVTRGTSRSQLGFKHFVQRACGAY